MPSATDVQVCRDRRGKSSPLDRRTAWLLFASLAAFSFVTGDYSLIGARIVSILLFLLSAVYLVAARKHPVHLSLAFACPFAMGLYGLGQITWSPQRIVFNALDKSLFWFTVALVALLATQLFQ